ncbi:MAG TPA: hypothetical protein VGA78_15780 [Gemmatimonadales bacterium]
MLATAIMPGLTVFPQLAWRWESETDILSGSYRTPRRGETAETVELSSPDGAVAVLDVVENEICGLDIVIWPDVETVSGLRPPAPQMAGKVGLPPPSGPRQIEEPLAVTVDGLEQTFHLRIGPERPVTVVQVADHLLIEVDASDQLAGFWLTGVPPFPSEE